MRRFFIFVLAALSFAACSHNDFEEVSADREAKIETLRVGFEGFDETRIQLDAWSGKTVWNRGDLVSVFYRSLNNTQWAFQGDDGARDGELRPVGTVTNDNDFGEVVVLYPYNEEYRLNPKDMSVDIRHAAKQHYNYRSYGEGGNVMVALSDFTQFTLRSVCGWLRIELTGSGERVEKIVVRGNQGEQIAGLAYVDAATAEVRLASESAPECGDDEVNGNLVFDNSILREVTLDCGEGVELWDSPQQFYVAMLPQTFSAGISFEVHCFDGSVMTKSTTDTFTLERNHIAPIQSMAYEGVIPPIYELHYRTDDGEPVSLFTDEGFGGNLTENRYDATTGEGVLAFDGQEAICA